jgi:hypothetical protein
MFCHTLQNLYISLAWKEYQEIKTKIKNRKGIKERYA